MTAADSNPLDRVQVVEGDITRQAVDAIVNAANSSLLGGGGVDGAIHRAAGPELLDECRTLGGCPPGEARLTRAYRLPARHVIHTVGPVWQGGGANEEEVLAHCYQSSLDLARHHGLRTIAFPAISTGAYGFPIDRAAGIALAEITDFLARDDSLEQVLLVCYPRPIYEAYKDAIREFTGGAADAAP